MLITHKNEIYELNAEQAIKLGVLKPAKKFSVELTVAEIQTLHKILQHIGGDPSSPRQHIDLVFGKIYKLYNIAFDNDLDSNDAVRGYDLKHQGTGNSLYFTKV